jgi:hypothetical protein
MRLCLIVSDSSSRGVQPQYILSFTVSGSHPGVDLSNFRTVLLPNGKLDNNTILSIAAVNKLPCTPASQCLAVAAWTAAEQLLRISCRRQTCCYCFRDSV